MAALHIEQECRGRHWNWSCWTPATILIVVVCGCFIWPTIARLPSPVNGDITSAGLPLWSRGHLFGTDPVGNDIFSRVLYGGRVSIEISLGSSLIGLAVGGLIGMIAGYRGGLVEAVTMRALDVLIAFPSLVLALVVAAYLGPGKLNVIWALSFFSVPAYARLAYARTLRLREQYFIRTAELFGARPLRVVLTHIAPDVLPQLMTFGYVIVSITVMFEASLSYLGLGVRPPAPSWGAMIAQGQEYLTTRPSLVLVPSAFLSLTVASLNVLGDTVRARRTSA